MLRPVNDTDRDARSVAGGGLPGPRIIYDRRLFSTRPRAQRKENISPGNARNAENQLRTEHF